MSIVDDFKAINERLNELRPGETVRGADCGQGQVEVPGQAQTDLSAQYQQAAAQQAADNWACFPSSAPQWTTQELAALQSANRPLASVGDVVINRIRQRPPSYVDWYRGWKLAGN